MVRLHVYTLWAVALSLSAHVDALDIHRWHARHSGAAGDPISTRDGRLDNREDAPATHSSSEPVILQPLRPIRPGNAKRDRRAAFALKAEETLYWGGQDGTVAKLRIQTPGETENIVNLELIDDMVRQITCPPSNSSGPFKLRFAEEADFNDAQDIWQWVNQQVDNHFLLLVGAGMCGWNADRIVYNITDLVYNDEAETAILQAQRTTWKQAAHTFDLTIGTAAVPPPRQQSNSTTFVAHRRRGLFSPSVSPSFSIPLASNLTSKSLSLSLPSPAALTASATCLDCHTSGSLAVQAHFAAEFFTLKDASIQVSLPDDDGDGAGLSATAVLSLALKGDVVDPVTRTVPLFEISPAGVSIPGIVTLGPTVGVSLGMEVGRVTAGVAVTMGGTASVAAGSVATLDFLDEKGTGSTGWGVEFRKEEDFKADASVETKAAVFLRAAVGVEVSVFETGFAAELTADAPTLSATLKAVTSSNCSVCGQFQNGVQGSLNFGATIGAGLTKKVAGTDTPLWSVNFAEANTPAIAEFCQGFGPQGQECLRATNGTLPRRLASLGRLSRLS
ncbi:hypothetical protein VTK56DRAFT_5289 [Thermocarpiscus australiensis]